jgi:hypothetical protein
MARRVILENSTNPNYSFNPATKTLIIPHYYPAERLVLITNITAGNKVIYNFSDPVLTATITPGSPSSTQTTIVLAYNTAAMSSTDKISVLVDEVNEYITPSETLLDPVSKFRVSTPQSLIDTDFEYGLQPTKWEACNFLNNRSTYFSNLQQPLTVTDITTTAGSKTATVTFTNAQGTGTVTTLTTSTGITGAGTTFTTEILPGYAVYTTANVFVGLISTVANSTFASLQANANAAISGTNYRFSPTKIPEAGAPIQVQDTYNESFNGLWIADSRTGANVAYTGVTAANTTESIYNSIITTIFSGGFYTGAAYSISSITNSGTLVTFTTNEPHGLNIGSDVYCYGLTASTNAPNGNWTVVSVTSSTSFKVRVTNAPTGSIAVGPNGGVYARPYGVAAHRPYDGGTSITCGTGAQGNSMVRQTRRYFRYQSGKGIQWSTGTILRPNIIVDQISSSGTTVTVTTKIAHQLFPGVSVQIANCSETAYNGTFTVVDTPSNYTFTYTALTTPSATPASGNYTLSVANWYGAVARIGMFTNTNGMFFEYDGQTLWAVRRNSTTQLSGYINVTNGSATVTGATVNGVTTLFSKQVVPGQFVSIRGMCYRIQSIASDTSLTISPPYRGVTMAGKNTAIMSEINDVKVAQTAWNLDRMDGTGPSGYNIDLSKIQMFYMDYSWYGAGAIRFGFKDQSGQVIYCHRFIHNNIQTEAYLRSGNLPARYEVGTYVPETTLTATVGSGDTSISVANTANFPSAGSLLIRDPANMEYVNYTGKTSGTFTGVTRGQAGNTALTGCTTVGGSTSMTTTGILTGLQVGQRITGTGIQTGTYIVSLTAGSPNTIQMSRAATAAGTGLTMVIDPMGVTATGHTYAATAPIAVSLAAPQFVPAISHWGSSVIMDGRYDDDKSFVFSTPSTSTLNVPAGGTSAILSIRLAPSVDSGITGLLGAREIINTMQLTLRQMDVFTNGNFLVKLILNGTVDAGDTWQSAGSPSLSQVCYHTVNKSVTGGDLIYAFFVNNGGGGTAFSATQQDLNLVRDMGNSISGGGTTNAIGTQVYPDGPDTVTVVVTSLNNAAQQVSARLSWTEAQA